MMAESAMLATVAASTAQLPAVCNRRLAEFLRRVDEADLVWLQEIKEEAARMFSRYRHHHHPHPPPPPAPGRSPR